MLEICSLVSQARAGLCIKLSRRSWISAMEPPGRLTRVFRSILSHIAKVGLRFEKSLAHASGKDPFGADLPKGAANPANHIRTVVTVNSPHFGTVFSADPSEMAAEYASSQKRLVLDSADFEKNYWMPPWI